MEEMKTNSDRKTDMDCSVCKRRKECASQAEGKFCDSFHSETFNPEKQNPLKTWEKERQALQEVKKK